MGRHFPGLLFLATFCLTNQVSATTIPAGTGLSVRTTEPLSSDNPPRTKFGAQLERDVIVRGKRVLPAGTRLRGQIVSSRSFDFTPVVLNVTSLASKGRLIPIKTVEGFRMDGTVFKTRRGISVGRGGFFAIPTGTQMQFRLAQSINSPMTMGADERFFS